ncbi:MAG: hypothetical protein WBN68_16315, partial [Sedimenticolaceae bacterium]
AGGRRCHCGLAAGGRRVSDRQGGIVFREMGYSVEEFNAVLPAAMRDWRVSGGPHHWRVIAADGSLVTEIHIEPRADRAIGALSLPVLAVTIDLGNTHSERVGEFLHRFNRGFHRGGG